MPAFTRRDFMRSGLIAAGAGLIVPPALAKGVLAASNDGIHNDRVLVVLQLGGGNDGLNTVIPYGDPAYARSRPTLGVKPETVLRINESVGLNPALKSIKSLYDAGRVAIVQGVGYDQPTYSHFEALAVWEYADPRRSQTEGWLGRLLEHQMDSQGHPLTACALGQPGAPAELRSNGGVVSAVDSLDSYVIQGGQSRNVAAPALYRRTPGPYGALFDSAAATAQTGISALHDTSRYTPSAQYSSQKVVYGSKNDLASSLQLAAQLIVTRPETKLVHVVLGGWDTHQQQDTRQAALLAQVDSVVGAFMQDLAAHGVADRVVLFSWSEFGRRVTENGSRGTDHGAAMPVLVIGSRVRGGLYGEQPSLTQTVDSGNLRYNVDFRSVYQAMIRDWLGGDAGSALGGSFPDLPLVQAA